MTDYSNEDHNGIEGVENISSERYYRRQSDKIENLTKEVYGLTARMAASERSIETLFDKSQKHEMSVDKELRDLSIMLTSLDKTITVYIASQKASDKTAFNILKEGWPIITAIVIAAFTVYQVLDAKFSAVSSNKQAETSLPPTLKYRLEDYQDTLETQRDEIDRLNSQLKNLLSKKAVRAMKP